MRERMSRAVAGFLIFWLMILLYMNTSLFSVEMTGTQLKIVQNELNKLNKQNKLLLKLADQLKTHKKETGNLVSVLTQQLTEAKKREKQLILEKRHTILNQNLKTRDLGPQHEYLRRKIQNGVVEMWYFTKSELNKIRSLSKEPEAIKEIDEVLEDFGDMQRAVLTDIYNLSQVDGAAEWRQQEAQDLSDLIQKRLYYLQNPKNCSKAKKLVCDINKGCGFGCQVHHLVYCLIMAYGSQRTMILNSENWTYSMKGWTYYFKPVSDSCVSIADHSRMVWWAPHDVIKDVQVVHLPILDTINPRPAYIPPSIPEDIAARLKRLHGHPIVWWIGQFIQYLMRPQPWLEKSLKEKEQTLGFNYPVVGVHIRRTDKIQLEASFHSIEEYMVHVEEYYKLLKRRQKVDIMRVYLATDDPKVLDKAIKKYPNYKFISDTNVSKTAAKKTRYSDESLTGIIMDIYFLSKSNYLVCTFSSQVCRLAYEIMQTLWPDASSFFHSLDDIYYFGGQGAHNQMAIYEHIPRGSNEIQLQPGDLIGVAGNHWDGYSMGTNKKLGQMGIYPSYKVIDRVDVAKFPTYPEADRMDEDPR